MSSRAVLCWHLVLSLAVVKRGNNNDKRIGIHRIYTAGVVPPCRVLAAKSLTECKQCPAALIARLLATSPGMSSAPNKCPWLLGESDPSRTGTH